MKRLLDVFISFTGLLILSPVLIIFIFLIYLQDKYNPFYVAPRVGKDGVLFNMIKLRTMVMGADKNGIKSTSADDRRITGLGHIIRRFKLDEITQLFNVLTGDMSLVGPRPNLKPETDLYTTEENKLLTVKPGITDFSSIVFSDEGEILKGSSNPDLSYHQLIRPWKSRLGIIYIENQSVYLDIKLIAWTVIAIINKKLILKNIVKELEKLNVDINLLNVCRRDCELVPAAPPGADKPVEFG